MTTKNNKAAADGGATNESQTGTESKQSATTLTPTSYKTVKVGKGEAIVQMDNYEPAAFTSFLGRVISTYDESLKFDLFGKTIIVPGKTANNDAKERTLAALKQLVKAAFGDLANTEALPKDAIEQTTVLKSVQAAGFKFSHFTKVAVSEAIDCWIKNKRAKKQFQVGATRKLNAVLIAETSTIREVNAIMKTKGIEAARQFIADKKLALPAIEA